MKALLKQLYDYQWELTLIGAQLDEQILRCQCSGNVEAAVRGQCRSLIITASDIKYDLISLEQAIGEDKTDHSSENERNELVRESFQEMERSLFLIIKNYVNLMSSVEDLPEEIDALNLLKESWPKIAETYQYFKTCLMEIEEDNYL
jgi:hypothetical protein